MKLSQRTNSKGFTLIELLIVIVIIGILSGVLLTVLNPAQQQAKARQTVLRSNVEKACLALHSCGATTANAANCQTMDQIGAILAADEPASSTYAIANSVADDPDGTVTLTGTLPAANGNPICQYTCGFNFATGAATPAINLQQDASVSSACLIE